MFTFITNVGLTVSDFVTTGFRLQQMNMKISEDHRALAETDMISNIYNKPTRCNSGSIVFINNYKYALHVSDALCVHRQEHYKL